jgi:hypothetical protein
MKKKESANDDEEWMCVGIVVIANANRLWAHLIEVVI